MIKNRIQCTLVFTDDEMYQEFIKPLKAQRQLSDFIVNLITQYYYSSKVREAISSTNEGWQAESDVFKEIHESLAMIDFLIQESKDTLADGRDVLNNINNYKEEVSSPTYLLPNNLGEDFIKVTILQDTSTMQKILDIKTQEINSIDVQDLESKLNELNDNLQTILTQGIPTQTIQGETVKPTEEVTSTQVKDEVASNLLMDAVADFIDAEPEQVEEKGEQNEVTAQSSLQTLLGSLDF